MNTDNQVRLADFGFARMFEEGMDTMTGVCGTKVLYGSDILVSRRARTFIV